LVLFLDQARALKRLAWAFFGQAHGSNYEYPNPIAHYLFSHPEF